MEISWKHVSRLPPSFPDPLPWRRSPEGRLPVCPTNQLIPHADTERRIRRTPEPQRTDAIGAEEDAGVIPRYSGTAAEQREPRLQHHGHMFF